jgi:hypothetical protein
MQVTQWGMYRHHCTSHTMRYVHRHHYTSHTVKYVRRHHCTSPTMRYVHRHHYTSHTVKYVRRHHYTSHTVRYVHRHHYTSHTVRYVHRHTIVLGTQWGTYRHTIYYSWLTTGNRVHLHKLTVPWVVKKFSAPLEPEDPLPCSHVPCMPFLSCIDHIVTVASFSFRIHLNVILPSMPRSSN